MKAFSTFPGSYLKNLMILFVLLITTTELTTKAYSNIIDKTVSSGDSVMIENRSFMVLFETNQHSTHTFPKVETERLKKLLEEFPAFSVRLEARTDSIGSPRYNFALAEKRIAFVRNELIKRGIARNRIIEFVFGEEEPLADNQSPEGRQANRSVRVVAGLYTPIRMISGRFISDDSKKGIEGVLYLGSRHHRDSIAIDSTGEFSFPVPDKDIFFIEFFSKDRIMERTYFNLNRTIPSFLTIPLKVLQTGDNFSFTDINFVAGRTEILPNSRHSLNRILHMIQIAEDYRFEIQGHVNLPGSTRSRDHGLSDARAQKIHDYLIQNGIDSNRLEWRGYGNWMMIFPEPETKSQHRRNRRVSVRVLGRIDSLGEEN